MEPGDSDSAFPCDGCGCCCRSLEGNPLLRELDRGDGVCVHFLPKEKRCGIYQERPLYCNVRKMYEKYFAAAITWDTFKTLNLICCGKLKEGKTNDRF